MTISMDDLEHAAAPGWRAADEERLGDWLLRAAHGFTGRANSALAAGDPGRSLPDAFDAVCRWYAVRDLPAVIAVPYPTGRPAGSHVDPLLAELGWTIRAGAATVMTAYPAHIAAGGARPELLVDIDGQPDQAWLDRYHYRGQALPLVARRLLTSSPWQAFASVRTGGTTVAIGRVAGSGRWAGLTAIEVEPEHRRRGMASAVTAALASFAAARGASGLYLQVEDDNLSARALYRRLGFTDHHGYHYRIAPP